MEIQRDGLMNAGIANVFREVEIAFNEQVDSEDYNDR